MSENNIFKNKRILVTGGTGSIGGEVVRQLLEMGPEVVRIFSRSEYNQFRMASELEKYRGRVRFLIGDVRDRERLEMAMKEIDIIFHAAALKHVPVCEYNPFEAVKTNVIGTQNVINAALESPAERVILVSTDKAVSPVNTMGATKLLSERLFSSANYFKGKREIVFASVRFGNVIGSRGSVIPTLLDQIREGGPVTVTDPEMSRFFMTLRQAVSLVLRAAAGAQGAEVYILKMPVFRIMDLVQLLIDTHAKRFGHDPKKIKVEIIGRRPGERLYEELMTAEESNYMEEREDMYVIRPSYAARMKAKEFAYRSDTLAPVTVKELRRILKEEKLI